MSDEHESRRAAWLQPAPEQEGLAQYVATLRERIWVLVLALVITTGLAIAYVVTTEKTYEAEAHMLVSPTSTDSPILASLGLIVESPDPIRAVETAAALVTTNEVAEQVIAQLDLGSSPDGLLGKVEAEPLADSNLVAVTAKDDTPEGARDIANAFARQAIDVRIEALRDRIGARLPGLRAQLEVADPLTADALRGELATVEGLQNAPDHPNLEVVTPADVPDGPVAPRPVLSVAGGLLAGLVLGIGGAFALQVLDPRLRREEQLRRLFRLPVLARVTRQRARTQQQPLGPRRLSSPALEAYRTLRSTIAVRGGGQRGSQVILVTGSSPSEGKTTTAVNLAASLAAAGNRVILIDADLRRPSVPKALGLPKADQGLVGVLLENVELRQALVSVEGYADNLRVLPAEHEGGWIAELYSLPSTRHLVEDARELADYVVIDSAPLTAVIDALPLARFADQVVLVVRLGTSRLTSIQRLGELLAENGIEPAGFVLIGTAPPTEKGYYYHRRDIPLPRPEAQEPVELFAPERARGR